MKKSMVMLFLLMFLSFCLASPLMAGPAIDGILKKGELTVGTSGTYPPLTAKTKDGKLMGLDIDISGVIAESMGVRLNMVSLPFDELLPALESGKIDLIISNMTITPKRNLKVAFVGPYLLSGQAILTSKEVAVAVNTPEDVNKPDFTLAVPRGTTSEMMAKHLLPKAGLTVTKNTDEAVQLLMKEKVKAVMVDYPLCKTLAFRYKNRGLFATPPFTFEPIGIALRGDDPLFLNLLQNVLSMINNNGAMTMMKRTWFEDASWMKDLQEID
jgi:polar amino acid transport system substrate-binding protein